ncbi:MAG: DNA primase [Planctomycetota bacterium]
MVELSSDFKELVRSRTEIVSLIGESLTLQPVAGGREYQALCPFHDDHNPSMKVYPDRQTFRCWVCNEGGDVFSWVQKRENLSFFDALKMLAERAHIEMPNRSEREVRQQAKKDEVLAALAWAELQFHEAFKSDPAAKDARDYIASRGYSQETVDQFRIGCQPGGFDWIQWRARGQFSNDILEAASLVTPRREGSGYTDFFIDRVVWPIHDERKRPVAFGGRQIPGHPEFGGKYKNSGDTIVFHKSRILYGLPYARDAIKDRGSIVVVEGYADCVACHQAGVRNVVAGMGTALTEQQCQRVKAFAPKIVLTYDSDDAGQLAAARAVGLLLGQSVDLRVLTLPDGKDPDDFLKSDGAEAFERLVDQAPEAWEFRLNFEIQKTGVATVDAQERVLNEMATLLAGVPGLQGTAREDLILGRLATRLRMQEGTVRSQLDRARTEERRPARAVQRVDGTGQGDGPPLQEEQKIEFHKQPLSKEDRLEAELIEVLLTEPQHAEEARLSIGPDDFLNPHLRLLIEFIYDVVELGEIPTFERVTLEMESNELKGLAVWLSDQARMKGVERKLLDTDAEDEGLFRQLLNRMKWRREELSHQAALKRQSMAGDAKQDAIARLQQVAAYHRKRISQQ